MNYYKLYKKLRLDELGISSDEEAEELEFELELRFEEFTPKDRKTWLDQNAYLEHFSRTGTVTSAARRAGVTVYKAQRWKYDNVLGFTRRLEVATLVFKDRLKQKVLLRASDPKAPATLLIELLRAYIPEEFSRNGHKCDTSKADELLRRFREDARRELEAGHPTLRKIAEGATNAPPSDDREPSYSNLSPTPGDPHNSNLSPAGGEIQRGSALHTDPHAHQPSPDASEVSQHEPTSPTRHSRVGTSPRTPIRESTNGPFKPNWAKPNPKRPSITGHPRGRPSRRLPSIRPRRGAVPHQSLPRCGRPTQHQSLPRWGRPTQHQSLPRRGRDTERGFLPRPATRATATTKKERKEKHLPRSPLLTRTTHLLRNTPYPQTPQKVTKCYTYSDPHSLSAPCALRGEPHTYASLLSSPQVTKCQEMSG